MKFVRLVFSTWKTLMVLLINLRHCARLHYLPFMRKHAKLRWSVLVNYRIHIWSFQLGKHWWCLLKINEFGWTYNIFSWIFMDIHDCYLVLILSHRNTAIHLVMLFHLQHLYPSRVGRLCSRSEELGTSC